MKVLVTGGAGFVGSNVTSLLYEKGYKVTIFDSLFRKGSENNIKWIKETMPGVEVLKVDIGKHEELKKASAGKDFIVHCAAQTAVTTSITDPRGDFEANALGTFNVMEAARKNGCGVIYTSTNKVYGDNVNKVPIKELKTRYDFSNEFAGRGIPPSFPIGAREHTPYGCSKLSGELYVKDYFSVYGVPTVVNRMSCIYGTRQFGTTDQGWVSYFINSVLFGKPFTVYGDGKQVRDILFGQDLARLILMQMEKIDSVKGGIFNTGGGYGNTVSLLELLKILEKMTGKEAKSGFSGWRPADQKVYYSDISALKDMVGWRPEVSYEEGIRKTMRWMQDNERASHA